MTLNNPQDHIKRGLLWMGSSSLYTRLLSFGSTLVVMWFLSREDMGIAAIAWSVSVLLEAFNGLGVGASIIQAQRIERRETDSLFWFATGLAGLLTVGIALCAPLLAGFYGNPRLVPLIVVSATKLVFVGIALVPLQLLNRSLRFKEIGGLQAAATTLSSVLCIVLAAAGTGAWAPVIANTANGLFTLLVVYLMAPYWPRPSFAFSAIKRHLSFGIRVAVSGIIFHFYRNVDFFIIGKMLGMEALGVYRVAFDLAMEPAASILNVVNRVAYPVFARIAQETEKLFRTFVQMTRYNIMFIGPIAVYFAVTSTEVIDVITNERWIDGAPALAVLGWAGLLRSLVQIFPQLFHARGKPELAIYDSLASLVVFSGAFTLALHWFSDSLGIMAVCYAWLLCYPLLLLLLVAFARRIMPFSPVRYMRELMPIGLSLVVLMAVLWPLSLIRNMGIPAPWYLVVMAIVGLLTYGLYLWGVMGIRPKDLAIRREAGRQAIERGGRMSGIEQVGTIAGQGAVGEVTEARGLSDRTPADTPNGDPVPIGQAPDDRADDRQGRPKK